MNHYFYNKTKSSSKKGFDVKVKEVIVDLGISRLFSRYEFPVVFHKSLPLIQTRHPWVANLKCTNLIGRENTRH